MNETTRTAKLLKAALADKNFIDTTSTGGMTPDEAAEYRAEMTALLAKINAGATGFTPAERQLIAEVSEAI